MDNIERPNINEWYSQGGYNGTDRPEHASNGEQDASSPRRRTDAIIKEHAQAKTEALVQAYSFTSAPIAKALLYTHKRGVTVQVILDKSQKTQKYSSATEEKGTQSLH